MTTLRGGLERVVVAWVSRASLHRQFPVGSCVAVLPLPEAFVVEGWAGVRWGQVRVRHCGSGRIMVTEAWRLRAAQTGLLCSVDS